MKAPAYRLNVAKANASGPVSAHGPVQRRANKTGLPDTLKAGIEHLSGHSMDDVKVHYNSSRPAALQAHAYAQGTDTHLAPGQERHLPHEAWHVVQQKQGRVKPTRQLKGKTAINDNRGLEKEADVMGQRALRTNREPDVASLALATAGYDTVQLGGGNRGTETVKYGLGGLIVGAALCWLLMQSPGLALTWWPLLALFLPTILGSWQGYREGLKQEEDAEEWENLQPILKLFPNQEPEALEGEIETFKKQKEFDGGDSFIVSYKQRRAFERRLNTGEGFLWVYTEDKDLRIGSKEKNQHSVVAGGKKVYGAGEGEKPAAASPVTDQLGTIRQLELRVKKFNDGRGTYEAMLKEAKENLKKLKQEAKPNTFPNDVIRINLRSGHYMPDLTMDEWQLATYAWKQAGYKTIMRTGGGNAFLPKDRPKDDTQDGKEDKKNK